MNHKNIPLNERIIFALDLSSTEEAKKWVELLGSHINFFKVGLQLFIAGWFPVIDMITARGRKVMCDLKYLIFQRQSHWLSDSWKVVVLPLRLCMGMLQY